MVSAEDGREEKGAVRGEWQLSSTLTVVCRRLIHWWWLRKVGSGSTKKNRALLHRHSITSAIRLREAGNGVFGGRRLFFSLLFFGALVVCCFLFDLK